MMYKVKLKVSKKVELSTEEWQEVFNEAHVKKVIHGIDFEDAKLDNKKTEETYVNAILDMEKLDAIYENPEKNGELVFSMSNGDYMFTIKSTLKKFLNKTNLEYVDLA